MTQQDLQEQALNEPTLSKDPRLSELFDFIKTDEGVRVLPVTVRQDADDTRLFIAIQGSHETASTIMAQLMAHIDELHDLAAQEEARQSEQRKPEIVTP